ncbi:uncharacterized protein B0I36DRAFT_333723 [Microdochium trichocladiopsis]|uniref:Uncharacterized protein n=1 Tax=Microdochium trichocladiopsis TaxID=1682393 RepID=A0A9P8XVR4_9PEZI|nr:uncharacterized protein B0I36DRAFT_333723 [Microdochium trichocladiopsis]KAH7021065.1 hypothetical protein B0I36DRAFT_333723 [Microdochium trichocladiopsis]
MWLLFIPGAWPILERLLVSMRTMVRRVSKIHPTRSRRLILARILAWTWQARQDLGGNNLPVVRIYGHTNAGICSPVNLVRR